ncbi:MAG: DUF1844 domain-containing protein [bacterium]
MSDSKSETDPDGSFRVVDRRRFDGEGAERSTTSTEVFTERPPAPGEEASAAAPPTEAATAAPESRAEAPPTEAATAAPESRAEAPPAQFGEAQGEPRDVPPGVGETVPTFSSLILSLSTQALLSLGEISEAAEAPPHIDLVAGRQLIDLLGILQGKTQGNLDASEAELLERILYDLRLRFVEISRQQKQSPKN